VDSGEPFYLLEALNHSCSTACMLRTAFFSWILPGRFNMLLPPLFALLGAISSTFVPDVGLVHRHGRHYLPVLTNHALGGQPAGRSAAGWRTATNALPRAAGRRRAAKTLLFGRLPWRRTNTPPRCCVARRGSRCRCRTPRVCT